MNSNHLYSSVVFGFLALTALAFSEARSCRSCVRPRSVVRRAEPVAPREQPVVRTVEPKHKEATPLKKEISKIETEVEQEFKKVETEIKKEFKAGGKVISVESMTELDKHITGNDRVIIDVYASWCGPCKGFAPTYDKFAEKHPEITCLKIDGEHVRAVRSKFNITSGYPTFVLIKKGTMVGKTSGAPTPNTVERFETKMNTVKGTEGFLD